MPTLILYIIKLSVSLSILWLFYFAVLRRLTFYTWNRWYLLGYSLLSFFIPFIDIESLLSNSSHQPIDIPFIPAISDYTHVNIQSFGHSHTPTAWEIALLLIASVAIFLLTRTLVRWYSLSRVRKQAHLISDNGVRIYQVNREITPFSFGRSIYINPRLHTEKEWEQIILHEYIHIRQRHTLDILLAEALTILNWYNPFTWAIRHSIRQNLEFIADQKVLDNGVDKKGYQYHLLKVVGHPHYRLANNFNFSSLKKRIIMMNKVRSARLRLLRFLFLLPLLAVILLSFREGSPNPDHRQTQPIIAAPATVTAPTDTSTGTALTRPTQAKSGKAPAHRMETLLGTITVTAYAPKKQPPPPAVPDTVPAAADTSRRIVDTTSKNLLAASSVPTPITWPKTRSNPIFILDGIRLADTTGLRHLNPNDIESISVLKGQAAGAQYGPAGETRGVVLITTKKAQKHP